MTSEVRDVSSEQWIEEQLEMIGATPELAAPLTAETLRWLATPKPAPPGSEWRAGVIYGTGGTGGRGLALYLYARGAGERRPGIVFLHGGGWQSGHPYMLVHHARELAANGYVTATISYRFSAEARWPAALEDAKCAVRWMRAHASEIGLDPDRIAVAGGSAGGHLAAMVALTPGHFEGTGGWETFSSDVQAAVLYNPALDLRSEGLVRLDAVQAFLGDTSEVLLSEASPITYVTPACPPVLTRVGDEDVFTTAQMCESFHRELDAQGVPNRLESVPGKGHGIPLHDHTGCVRSTIDFLGEQFARQESAQLG